MPFKNASLRRLAAALPQQPRRLTAFQVLFASMAREASLAEDRVARISFLEGLMGKKPGTYLRDPSFLEDLQEALASGLPDPVLDHLLYERRMSEKSVKDFVGNKDRKLWEALLAGVSSGMPSDVRGRDRLDVAQSIAMGLSPITLDPLGKYKGGNVFWFLGDMAKGRGGALSLGGLASTLKNQGKQQAIDLVRGTSSLELGQSSLQDPALAERGRSMSEGPESTLQDVVSGETAVPRADYVRMAEAIFTNPKILGILDREVRKYLRGPAQVDVWETLKANPTLFIIRKGQLGIEQMELARMVAERTGREISRQKVGEHWRKSIWPAILLAFENSNLARAVLQNRQILDVVSEATRRPAPTTEPNFPIYYEGEGPVDSRTPAGPGRIVPPEEFEQEIAQMGDWWRRSAKKVALRWARKEGLPITVIESRDITKSASGELVPGEARILLSWQMPARERQMYSKLRKWALANWKRFMNPYGDLDTDDLAEEMAAQAGKRSWAEDPDHWVYEIAYDVNRLVPSLRV